MDRKELEILKKTDRVNGTSYRTHPTPSPCHFPYKGEKELLSLNAPEIKFQKAVYQQFASSDPNDIVDNAKVKKIKFFAYESKSR